MQSKSASGTYNRLGFSLIEVIVAMTIVALVATVTIPQFLSVGVRPIDSFIIDLNNISQSASLRARETRQPQKVIFNFEQGFVTIEDEPSNSISIPDSLRFVNLVVSNVSEFATGTAYFLINKQGISQTVTVDIQDVENNTVHKVRVNPFSVQFSITEV
jgi:prepilin-type N-terminal cleavage/methylation domain-containing protein